MIAIDQRWAWVLISCNRKLLEFLEYWLSALRRCRYSSLSDQSKIAWLLLAALRRCGCSFLSDWLKIASLLLAVLRRIAGRVAVLSVCMILVCLWIRLFLSYWEPVVVKYMFFDNLGQFPKSFLLFPWAFRNKINKLLPPFMPPLNVHGKCSSCARTLFICRSQGLILSTVYYLINFLNMVGFLVQGLQRNAVEISMSRRGGLRSILSISREIFIDFRSHFFSMYFWS